ncbi:MAG: putative enzyme of poly-gamma-glutamate biosynthesis (Capsule formation)-like protein [Candidatus Acidoferrum typicum]|nr:putative enzyme of poly-gamma-glutamate biosynthesis (Capsule formation)-like protein [Candidatus Acidoferrum typicum]
MNKSIIRDRILPGKRAVGTAAAVLLLFFLGGAVFKWEQNRTPVNASVKVSYPQEISRITFAAAGDVIPHQSVYQSAAALSQSIAETQKETSPEPKDTAASQTPSASNHGGWDLLFANVADVFRQADFGFVNLETPVAPSHSHGSKPFQFDAPINLLQALKFSGVEIVSIANNHVFDQGYAGFAETQDHLREQGILFTGAGSTAETAWKPVVLEKNGIKVGWLGMTRWLNGGRNPEKESDPHVAFFPYPGESMGAPGLDESAVLDAIKSARTQCDLLVISIHWGVEYATAPNAKDVDIAHDMLDAGASAVIGHHPHVLQPIETYVTHDDRSTLIVYSLGNFISNQARTYVGGLTPDKTGEQRDSLVIKFSAIKRDYGPAGIRVELGDMGILPAWTENNSLQVRAGHAKTLFIGPVFLDREIPRLQTRYDELDRIGPQLSPEQKQEMIQVANRLQMLKHRRELLLARTGDEYVVAPPKLPNP